MWCLQNFEVKQNLTKMLFLVVNMLEFFFLKSNLSIKNPMLKMNGYDFSIEDFVQRYPLQFSLSLVFRAIRNDPQIHYIPYEKT
jgi:hypothetical protein